MPGLIFVSPGRFDNASELPQISTLPTAPVLGASIDWAAERLPLGPVDAWTDMMGQKTLYPPGPPGQRPVVVGEGTSRRVTFDGLAQRVTGDMYIDQPVTMAIVFRLPEPVASAFLFTGFNQQAWNLGVNSNGVRWIFSTGPGSSMMAPSTMTPDSNWHIFIICVNGENSGTSFDGVEYSYPIQPVTWELLNIGSTAAAYSKSELKRFSVIPRATTPADREGIRQQLAAHYGI